MQQSPMPGPTREKAEHEAMLGGGLDEAEEEEAEAMAAVYRMEEAEEETDDAASALSSNITDSSSTNRFHRRVLRPLPPPPPPFLFSAPPISFPLPTPRRSPPKAPSPSSLQRTLAALNARRATQLQEDEKRRQEVEAACSTPLVLEPSSSPSSSGTRPHSHASS